MAIQIGIGVLGGAPINERAPSQKMVSGNTSRNPIAVEVGRFPQLTYEQAEICTRLRVSEAEFLEAQARRRAGKDPLSDTILGGGGKRSVATGPSGTGGFRAV